MLTLLWHDGSITTGESWAELEAALRASQWSPYKSTRAFRREMRRRAAIWSGRKPKPVVYQTSRQFIVSLVHAGMCMLVDDDEPTTTTTTDRTTP